MYKIIKSEKIAPKFFRLCVKAPRISDKARAGQFVIIRLHEKGERIPLTICDYNRREGYIVLIFQMVGKTTKELSELKKDKKIENVLGPLGNPSKVPKDKKIICVAGGAGIAMIYPLIKVLKKKNNFVTSIIGSEKKSLVILKEEIKTLSDELFVTTDDGSLGKKGFVTDELERLLEKGRKVDEVFSVGPVVMMEKVAEICCPKDIKTTVSLNSIMIDGTGMCGGCRVTVGKKTKFTCVDGPEFDGCKVDFEELKARNSRFIQEEKSSYEHYCKLKENING